MAKEDEAYLTHNKHSWNQRIEAHLDSKFYDVEGFMKGKSSLDEVTLDFLGNVTNKAILHLQCHFGQDTLSMARMGANCTGVDLSNKAIDAAKTLNEKLSLDATFINTDVYSVPEVLQHSYDILFSSFGTIGWLPDMVKWANVVNKMLKPGGRLILIEFHPFVWMYNRDFTEIEYPYFNRSSIIEASDGTYADKNATVKGKEISWNHPLSDVIQSLVDKDLRVSRLQEYDYSPYHVFGNMYEVSPRVFRSKTAEASIPYFYGLECIKPQK